MLSFGRLVSRPKHFQMKLEEVATVSGSRRGSSMNTKYPGAEGLEEQRVVKSETVTEEVQDVHGTSQKTWDSAVVQLVGGAVLGQEDQPQKTWWGWRTARTRPRGGRWRCSAFLWCQDLRSWIPPGVFGGVFHGRGVRFHLQGFLWNMLGANVPNLSGRNVPVCGLKRKCCMLIRGD